MGKIELTPPLPAHLLDIASLGADGITHIMARIDQLSNDKQITNKDGPAAALLFFEDSTRTRLSFELACQNLNKKILSPNLSVSSINKGESLFDTVQTLCAMGVGQFVIRHPENHAPARIAEEIGSSAHIINAGDGTNQHPTQALTDLYILKRHCNDNFSSMSVGIVGNVSHSRVANSLTEGLRLLGATDIRLIGPTEWMPKNLDDPLRCFTDLSQGLDGLDALVILRAQKERITTQSGACIDSMQKLFQIDQTHLSMMKAGALIMHPGPTLRGQELTSAVADCSQSAILEQVRVSVFTRMAVLDLFA